MNGYDGSYTPPGWNVWKGRVMNDSRVAGFDAGGKNPKNVMHTDVFADEAVNFIRNTDRPMYLQVASFAPHIARRSDKDGKWLANYPDRHAKALPNLKAPRPKSYNERDVSDKPHWVERRKRLTLSRRQDMDRLYRSQARAMLGVDDLVGEVLAALEDTNRLENTYVIFTSDNGYHRGHHRLPAGKRSAYEEDIQVPLYIMGPEIVTGARDQFVLNNDLASTVMEFARAGKIPETDGTSFVPLLSDPNLSWRKRFLVEASGHTKMRRPRYSAVRIPSAVYVNYTRGRDEVYRLDRDRHQLNNLSDRISSKSRSKLDKHLDDLSRCAADSCREAEGLSHQ